jgi:uncharacterized protein YyaL (SSP411 family)
MATGGIYDPVGGGFARYSVDGNWHVPHFEKMLYDNGQLNTLNPQAYQWVQDPAYAQVVRESLQFIERELTDPTGGFYSSLDADSEGEEGTFYVWTEEEIHALFPDKEEREIITSYYDVRKGGNWEEGKNILRVLKPLSEIADKADKTLEDCERIIADAKGTLLKSRASRVRPGLDDKILTSWNALMLKGYLDAYKALGESTYLEIALKNAQFLEKQMLRADGGLNRNYKNGKSTINGFLDDYAILIEAWIALYQVTFDEQWLNKARKLADYAIAHFYDAGSGMFYYTSDMDPPLIARKKELSDNVIPASNSALAKGLYDLGLYFYEQSYLDHAAQMLHNMNAQLIASSHPGFFSNWCDLYLRMTWPYYEIAIVGDQAPAVSSELMGHFVPNAIFLGGKTEGSLQLLENKLQEGQTMIYVCRDKVCKFPVTTTDEALKLLD